MSGQSMGPELLEGDMGAVKSALLRYEESPTDGPKTRQEAEGYDPGGAVRDLIQNMPASDPHPFADESSQTATKMHGDFESNKGSQPQKHTVESLKKYSPADEANSVITHLLRPLAQVFIGGAADQIQEHVGVTRTRLNG